MNDLSISTGGFYLYAQAHAAYIAQEKMKFHRMIGASAGAAIAVISAIYGHHKMLEMAKSIDLRDAYTYIPYKDNGKMKAWSYVRWAFGWHLAGQDGRHILRKLVPQEVFEDYKNDHSRPECYVLSVDLQTMSRVVTNIRRHIYDDFIDRWESSMRMQGISEGLWLNGMYLVDGGQLDHVPSMNIINENTKNLVSIYSFPENWQLPKFDLRNAHPAEELFVMIKGDNREKAMNDVEKETRMCNNFGIKRYQIYIERHLLHSFDMNPERQSKSIQSAILSANKAFGGGKVIGIA